MIERPYILPVSKKVPRSTKASMIGRILYTLRRSRGIAAIKLSSRRCGSSSLADFGRHLLGHQGFLANGRVGRSAPHGEIVAHHDHRPAVDERAAEYAVRRREVQQLIVRVIGGAAGDRADLVEAAGVDELVDPL